MDRIVGIDCDIQLRKESRKAGADFRFGLSREPARRDVDPESVMR